MALDPSFDTDALAKALGIPSHKHMLHQHLYEELRSLALLHRYSPPPIPQGTSLVAHQYSKITAFPTVI